MHDYQLLQIMAVGFSLSLIFGFIAKKIGLSPIVGYLLAGFLIGPFSPGFVADYNLAFQLSEAGVILLMFGVGLRFKMEDLFAVRGVAIPGAIIQSVVTTVCGAFLGTLLGMDFKSALILGVGLSVASTVVLLKVLEDSDMLNTVHGHVAVGWLVVEDILTVLILVMLPSFSVIFSNSSAVSLGTLEVVKAIGIALIRVVLLWVLVIEGGGRFVPWLLSKIVKTRSQELFILAVLVIAFATAVIAAYVFQTSFALGAFLGGMVVGKSKVSHQAGADILPLRDAFAVLFFLSVGMLFDWRFVIEYPLLVGTCIGIVLLIKPITALVVVSVLGYSTKTALTVAAGLAQVGEFSFILAQEAKRLSLVTDLVCNSIVICAIVSIILNPSLFKKIPMIKEYLRSNNRIWRILNFSVDKKRNKANELAKNLLPVEEYLSQKTAIVVGYGPAGRKVTEALIDQGVKPVVIEMNIDTVNYLSSQGQAVIYGDSTRRDILIAAGINKASYLVITVPSLNRTLATASLASTLNPKTRVIGRSRFLNSKENLKQVGVSAVAFEEEEVSKALTSLVLDDLEQQSLLAAASEIALQTVQEKQ